MTTYTTISGALVAVGAKPFATTIQALRDNPIAIGEADASVPASLLPTVLLGTITTTSGTSQTLSGLVLTPYKYLRLVVKGVSSNTTAMNLGITGLSTIVSNALNSNTSTWYGVVDVDLGGGVYSASIQMSGDGAVSGRAGASTLTTATTSITVSITGGGSFDAGSVLVYGCK
jgi:hypothetical protein